MPQRARSAARCHFLRTCPPELDLRDDLDDATERRHLLQILVKKMMKDLLEELTSLTYLFTFTSPNNKTRQKAAPLIPPHFLLPSHLRRQYPTTLILTKIKNLRCGIAKRS